MTPLTVVTMTPANAPAASGHAVDALSLSPPPGRLSATASRPDHPPDATPASDAGCRPYPTSTRLARRRRAAPAPRRHTHDRHRPPCTPPPAPRPARRRPSLRPSPLRTALRLAADRLSLAPALDFDPDRRYYRRLLADEHHEAWLLSWLPGQGTDWHDHGGSGGAFVVAAGRPRRGHRACTGSCAARGTSTVAGSAHAFGPDYVHRVTNEGPDPAVSLHVYAPRLEVQHDYVSDDGILRLRRDPARGGGLVSPPAASTCCSRPPAPGCTASPRWRPCTRWSTGAVVVDIRPAAQRAEHGDLPGALVVERNVLEWRFDPTSEAALRIADDDLHVIVLCQEGYTSSLAAAALQDVGVRRATDVVGGYAAWVADGVAPPSAARRQRLVTRMRAG